MTGTVVRLMSQKNFGFIKGKNTDYFFHRDDFQGNWNDLVEDFNNRIQIEVKFVETESTKGARAAKVSRLDYPNQSV